MILASVSTVLGCLTAAPNIGSTGSQTLAQNPVQAMGCVATQVQAMLLDYLASGVGLFLAVVLTGIGVTMLVRWGKAAAQERAFNDDVDSFYGDPADDCWMESDGEPVGFGADPDADTGEGGDLSDEVDGFGFDEADSGGPGYFS